MKYVLLIATVFLLVWVAAPSTADEGGGMGSSADSEYLVDAWNGNEGSASGDQVDPVVDQSVPGEAHQEVVCAYQSPVGCTEPQMCPDQVTPMVHSWFEPDAGGVVDYGYSCPGEATVEDTVEITNEMVLRAFKRIPLPASELVVQPPGGETLVNFATNFYTEAGPLERSVTLVGQRVDLRIRPTQFGWTFGDGERASTTEPGAAYPDLEVTHEYVTAGEVGASVDTTYSAEFRVNGGAWEPVVGTVTMAGASVGLRVRTATPTLVGY